MHVHKTGIAQQHTRSPSTILRSLIQRTTPTVVPLVLDPISALMAQAEGFEAMYLGGGMMGYLKTSTEAHLSLTQMAQAGLEIRAASTLPLILDGQCGWGDPMHMQHTVATAEAAGFAAIEIEDQLMPKRVHHHVNIEHLISQDLMVEKIKVAVATRRSPDFVVIGRTNACRTSTLDDALRRAEAYRHAGADMLLVLPKSPEQARDIGERIEGPLFYMMLGGLPSIGMSMTELGKLGYRLIIDSVTPFLARQKALRLSYSALAQGLPDPTLGSGADDEVKHIHYLLGLNALLEIERRTVET
jgi:2-methylisocitrate lyase-like PEP mutase family enzyme